MWFYHEIFSFRIFSELEEVKNFAGEKNQLSQLSTSVDTVT